MAKDTTPPPFTFHIVAGPLAGKELYYAGKKFRVGRTKASSIQIKDPAVSEKHAEIVFTDGEWRIRDLGSSNGTRLNGSEVQGNAGAEARVASTSSHTAAHVPRPVVVQRTLSASRVVTSSGLAPRPL